MAITKYVPYQQAQSRITREQKHGESMNNLVKRVKEFKETETNPTLQAGSKPMSSSQSKCKECGKTFDQNWQLEEHMVEHENTPKFEFKIRKKKSS